MICGKNCHMMSYAASNLKLVTPKMTLQPHSATNPNNTRDRIRFMFQFMFSGYSLVFRLIPLEAADWCISTLTRASETPA